MNVSARAGLNGQAPRCNHIDVVPAAKSGIAECRRCLQLRVIWPRLVVCLTCGWVACSDGSAGGHAWEHYQETDHPVVAALEPVTAWRWCYVHGRAV
ncbi:hypothetical protein DQ384_10235 [Sphaerisporangium album]|uniref:UBP-type domain-containing protein n=1 Tax=Sphaerisporangium album TaxID=509200 RepID=A0A367FL46_9ACTN|nr:UBP-type zinc finger domain-containing protein [Sphaerisporangium album]RCG31126.1 hypothetical protein DQ384_10235 [Sphaerisporangium album]